MLPLSLILMLNFVFTSASEQCPIAQICVTDVTEADCFNLAVLPNINVYNCCPGCGTTLPVPNPDPDTPCQPPANCLPDGNFAPVQCKGDFFVGRCFCTDEDGHRIFGQMWRDEASEMTCACSRRRAELEASGRTDVTLHCTPTGDYEELQCDDGLCWCADPKTGQPSASPALEADMTLLPCYSASLIGEQYLRRCESVVHALAAIRREQSEHGTYFQGNPLWTTFCDYDGSYGPFQVQNGVAYCTGQTGDNLGSWQLDLSSGSVADLNCSEEFKVIYSWSGLDLENSDSAIHSHLGSSSGGSKNHEISACVSVNCARDTAVYFPQRGISVVAACQGNGNYQTAQNIGENPYCVDSDGYEIDCT